MGIVISFLKDMKKQLGRMEGKLDEMKNMLGDMADDLKFLRGKTVGQLLQMRRKRILRENLRRELDSIYVELLLKKLDSNDQFDNVEIKRFHFFLT